MELETKKIYLIVYPEMFEPSIEKDILDLKKYVDVRLQLAHCKKRNVIRILPLSQLSREI